MTACAIIDLPEPDSPTTHSVSPAAIESETLLDGVRAIGQRRQRERQALDREDGRTAAHHSRSLRAGAD